MQEQSGGILFCMDPHHCSHDCYWMLRKGGKLSYIEMLPNGLTSSHPRPINKMGLVKIYRVPRPGFGKNLLEKSLRPPVDGPGPGTIKILTRP